MDDYSKLLLSPDWQTKRKEIIERDGNSCTNCNNKEILSKSYLSKFSFGSYFDRTSIHVVIPEHSIDKRFNIDLEVKILLNILSNRRKAFCSVSMLDEQLYLNAIFEYDSAGIKLQNGQSMFLDDVLGLFDGLKGVRWLYTQGLHVHHSYYDLSLKPWEYPNDSLTTLCWLCHKKLHENQTIQVRLSEDSEFINFHTCLRCYGAGYFPQFRHVDSGICFRCRGARFEELISL